MLNTAIVDRIYQTPKPQVPSSKLQEIQDRKKPWKPFDISLVESNILSEHDGSYATIQRCIALALALELPVGNWALNGTKLENDQAIIAALQNNAHDELIHYEAFERVSYAYNMPESLLEEVNEFRDRLNSLDEHPVLLAGFVELSVFFVTLAILRKYGSSDLKRVVHYVSRDESTHVNTNYWIVDKLGLRFKDLAKVDSLRSEIIEWLVRPLKPSFQDFWMRQSVNLMTTRQAPDLDWTATANVVAFFEVPKEY